MILKAIVMSGGSGESHWSLDFLRVLLDFGSHVVGLEQEGGVGHVSFLLGGLRGQEDRSQCLGHWLSRWGSEGVSALHHLGLSNPSLC